MAHVRVTHIRHRSGQAGAYQDSFDIGEFFIERSDPMSSTNDPDKIKWIPWQFEDASNDKVPYPVKGLIVTRSSNAPDIQWHEPMLELFAPIADRPGWYRYQVRTAFTD